MLSNDIVTFVYLTSNNSNPTNPIYAIDAIIPFALYFTINKINVTATIAITIYIAFCKSFDVISVFT